MGTDGFYTAEQRRLQAHFDTVPLADRLEATIVTDRLDGDAAAFIASRDFFLLATVDADGMPTVSHKGGGVGVVTVVDPTTLAFPHYDGNGMFLSTGNIAETGRIGLLFIDFETPHRLRVQADATFDADDPLLAAYPGAQLIVRAAIRQAFVNCGRYIHPRTRAGASPHVPAADGSQPLAAWKRLDLFQDVLPAGTRELTADAGGPLDLDGYQRLVAEGGS